MTHQNRRTEKLFTVAMVAVLIGLIGIVSYYFGQTHVELVDSGWAKNANEVEPPVAAPERIDGPIFLDANNPRARNVVPPSQLIEQRTTPADGNPYLSTRKSIVSIDGFAEPMLRTEQLVTDPETGETLVDSSYEYVANQVVLFAQDPINKAKLESSLKDTHWKILDHSPNGLLVTLQAQEYTSTTVSDGISGIPELVGTAFQFGIEPNYVYHTQVIEPNDPIYESHQQWGLHNDNNDIDIDAPEGWEIENDASGVVVAIIDSGINFGHEDLIENLWVNDGETAHNGVDDDNNGYTDDVHGANTIDPLVSAEDDSGHGTHVAGILGARGNNAIGLTGVAWEIELMAVKFLGSNGKGLSKDGIEAIDYAVNNGADIINASYGGPYSKAKEQAIERARKKGIIVVAAAGNEGKRPTDEENYPAISSLDNVISVANIDWNGERSSSSNYDPTIVDVAAPGYEILSTYFDSSFAYSVQSGTSMAAPFVTGILALNRVHHPDDDYRTQIERVIASSSPRAELSNVSQSGGMVNLRAILDMDEVLFLPKILEYTDLEPVLVKGDKVTMSVTATSVVPQTFSWYFNGDLLVGETDSILTVDSVEKSDEGKYLFVASSEDGDAKLSFDLKVLEEDAGLAAALDVSEGIGIFPVNPEMWSTVLDPLRAGGSYIRGEIPLDRKDSSLVAQVRGPGDLHFLWKGEREEGEYIDYRFLVDGEEYSGLYDSYRWGVQRIELAENKLYSVEWKFAESLPPEFNPGDLLLDYIKIFPFGEVPPILVGQPEDAVVLPGQDVSVSAEVFGDDLTFEWFHNGVSLGDDLLAYYAIENPTEEDEGEYHLVASNAYGQVSSRKAFVDIDPNRLPITLVEGRKSVSARIGDELNISFLHEGSEPIQYQWFKEGIGKLERESGPTLSINPLRMEHAGNYWLEISNPDDRPGFPEGYIHEAHLRLHIEDGVLKKQSSFGGGMAMLAPGSRLEIELNDYFAQMDVEFRWYHNGVPLDGQTGPSLIVEDIDESHGGIYIAEIRNDRELIRSDAYHIIIDFGFAEALDFYDATVEGGGLFEVTREVRGLLRPQTIHTYDGEDALELGVPGGKVKSDNFSPPSSLYSEFSFEIAGPRNIGLYWKRDSIDVQLTSSVYPSAGQGEGLAKVFGENGKINEWERAVLHVPEGEHQVRWTIRSDNINARAWFDKMETTDEYTFAGEYERDLLIAGGPETREARVWGSGPVSYQWFKNGIALPGENTTKLTIEDASSPSGDSYFLRITSEDGQTDGSFFNAITVDDHFGLVESPISLGGENQWRINQEGIEAWPTASSPSWLEFDVQGPAVVTYKDYFDFNVHIDNVETLTYYGGNDPSGSRFFHVEEGAHKIRFNALVLGRYCGLDSLRVRPSPWFNPTESHIGEPYWKKIRADFLGLNPMTAQWFRNGEPVESKNESFATHVVWGNAPMFSDEQRKKNVDDAGIYYCEITDARGKTIRSRDFEVSLVDALPLGTLLDSDLVEDYYYRPTDFGGDLDIHMKGGSSAIATSSKGNTDETFIIDPTFSMPDEFNILEFYVRVEGADENTLIDIHRSSDTIVRVIPSETWQRIEIAAEDRKGIYFHVRKSEDSEVRIWVDSVTLSSSIFIKTQPMHMATSLNGEAYLSVEAIAPAPISYQWRFEGEPIDGATSEILKIDSMGFGDTGSYDVVLKSDGETVTSRSVNLEIADGLATALGIPSLKVTTWGDALWEVDSDVSVDGDESVRSGDVSERQMSVLRIEFDQQCMYSYYENYEIGESVFWSRRVESVSESPYIVDFVYVKPDESATYTTEFMRLDRLSFSPISEYSFNDWVEFKSSEGLFANFSGSLYDRDGDFDGDGITNELEYVFDLDVFRKDQLPSLISTGSGNELTYRLLNRWALSGEYSILFEFSEDLKSWYQVHPETKELGDSTDYYSEMDQTIRMPKSVKTRGFLKLSVQRNNGSNGDIGVDVWESVNQEY